MANNDERDPRTPRGAGMAVPAGMMKMIGRAGCWCAPMMAMCEEADQDKEAAAAPAEATATGPEGGVDP